MGHWNSAPRTKRSLPSANSSSRTFEAVAGICMTVLPLARKGGPKVAVLGPANGPVNVRQVLGRLGNDHGLAHRAPAAAPARCALRPSGNSRRLAVLLFSVPLPSSRSMLRHERFAQSPPRRRSVDQKNQNTGCVRRCPQASQLPAPRRIPDVFADRNRRARWSSRGESQSGLTALDLSTRFGDVASAGQQGQVDLIVLELNGKTVIDRHGNLGNVRGDVQPAKPYFGASKDNMLAAQDQIPGEPDSEPRA